MPEGKHAELEQHIAFAARLIAKYQWSEDVRRDFAARLEEIRKKQTDPNLNLSVIGEFSSGKSTFINALLRNELLASGVLQGTTVASTVIEAGETMLLIRRYRDGSENMCPYTDYDELKADLNTAAAENDEAEALLNVTVRFPFDSLREGGFRIIDTPGLDATVQWHEEATVRTLHDVSDLSIILVDAVRPLPDSLCEFISEHLAPILDKCVFVLTKMDLIPPRERAMLIKYVKKAAKVRFGLETPLVLPYASLDVIRTFSKEPVEEGKFRPEPAVSLESETQILAHMSEQRTEVQTQKLLALTERIYMQIEEQMRTLIADYEDRLDLLRRTRQADLSGFIEEQKQVCTGLFDERIAPVRQALFSDIDGMAANAQQMILGGIHYKRTADELNDYVKIRLQLECSAQAEQMCWRLAKRLREQREAAVVYGAVLADYREAFQAQFRRLDCLVPQQGQAILPTPNVPILNLGNLTVAAQYTQQTVNKENRRLFGGAAAGAAAGSIIPGLGTVVGAAIGLFAGSMFGVNLNEMKQQTQERLRGPLAQYFTEAANGLKQQTDQYIAQVRGQIGAEIDRYLSAYRETVDGWIAQEEMRRSELETKTEDIRQDMQRISDVRAEWSVQKREELPTAE